MIVAKRRINNNVIFASENGQELVVTGKGIGFQVYPGSVIDESHIEQKFYAPNEMSVSQLIESISKTESQEIAVIVEIISMVKSAIPEINDSIFFALLDHLMYAITRTKNEMNIESPLEWEVKKFYKKEYELALKALHLIQERIHIELPRSEAAFFGLHFINAQLNSVVGDEVFELTELTNSVAKIVKYSFNRDFDEESFFFNRFITHIRYFLMRYLKKETLKLGDEDEEFMRSIINSYPEEYYCTTKIADFLHDKKGWEVTDLEKMYLILHIRKLY